MALADSIMNSQTAEIATMQDLLAGLNDAASGRRCAKSSSSPGRQEQILGGWAVDRAGPGRERRGGPGARRELLKGGR